LAAFSPFNSTQWRWRRLRWQRQFDDLLHGRTSADGVSVTRLLIATNILFFLAMVVQGMAAGQGFAPLLNPDPYLLVHGGAQYWPLVLYQGEWWRCLTYAYTHGGLIHIGFNMVVLYQIGPLLESELGAPRFIVLYTLTALTATGLGYLWHPMVPVVGASGSLFGLIGFAVTWYHRMGTPGHHIRNIMLRWAVFAFVFGLVVGADNAGHLGGALGGALLGLVLPLGVRGRRTLAPLFNGLALLCLAATVGSLALLVVSWFRAAGGA